MEFCKKQNILSQFSAASLKFTLNFQRFEKKDEPHSGCLSVIIDREGRCYLNV